MFLRISGNKNPAVNRRELFVQYSLRPDLKRVQLSIFYPEVSDIGFNINAPPGNPLDQFRRGELTSVPVDVLPEPSVEYIKHSPGYFKRYFRPCLQCFLVKLGRKDVSEGVSLELSADLSSEPVNILHASLTVL